MKKTRSDAKWLSLKPEQIALLAKWLFEEKLSYDDALARAKEQFGFTGSKTSLRRFYRREEPKYQRCQNRVANGRVVSANSPNLDEEALLGSGMQLMAKQFLDRMQGEDIDDPAALARLLLQSEANGLRREANALRRRGQALRERDQKFDERRWEFDVEKAAKKLVPMFQQILNRMGPAKKTYKYAKFINRVRMRLFGSCPDRSPESAEAEREIAERQAYQKACQEAEEVRERCRRELDPNYKPQDPDSGGAKAETVVEAGKPENPPGAA